MEINLTNLKDSGLVFRFTQKGKWHIYDGQDGYFYCNQSKNKKPESAIALKSNKSFNDPDVCEMCLGFFNFVLKQREYELHREKSEAVSNALLVAQITGNYDLEFKK